MDHLPAPQPGAVKSADRVLDLFELLGRWGREMSHAEISGALEIPKSSLTQLLRNLTHRGYVEYVPARRGYRLGEVFSRLARQTGRTHDIVACAGPVLDDITARTNESSALNSMKGNQVEVVATVSSRMRLATQMRLGDLAPLYATSGGKIILANLPEAMQAEYLAGVQFERITPETIHSVRELKTQLRKIREDAVAYSFEEFTPGIVDIATVVLLEDSHPAGSLNIAMPTVRYNPETQQRALGVLREAAAALAAQLNSTQRG